MNTALISKKKLNIEMNTKWKKWEKWKNSDFEININKIKISILNNDIINLSNENLNFYFNIFC